MTSVRNARVVGKNPIALIHQGVVENAPSLQRVRLPPSHQRGTFGTLHQNLLIFRGAYTKKHANSKAETIYCGNKHGMHTKLVIIWITTTTHDISNAKRCETTIFLCKSLCKLSKDDIMDYIPPFVQSLFCVLPSE